MQLDELFELYFPVGRHLIMDCYDFDMGEIYKAEIIDNTLCLVGDGWDYEEDLDVLKKKAKSDDLDKVFYWVKYEDMPIYFDDVINYNPIGERAERERYF